MPADPRQTLHLSLHVQPCAAQTATAAPLNGRRPRKPVIATRTVCLHKGVSETTPSAPTRNAQSQSLCRRASRRVRAARDGVVSRAGQLMATPTATGITVRALTRRKQSTRGGRSTSSGIMPLTRWFFLRETILGPRKRLKILMSSWTVSCAGQLPREWEPR